MCPQGWDITVPMPARFEDDFFELALPAGSYHLFQHLIGEPYAGKHEGRATETYRPVYGYGGIPVRIRREEILRLPDFEESPLHPLEVEAVDHTGVPVKPGLCKNRSPVLKNESRSGPTRKRAGVTGGFAKNIGWGGV